MGAPAGALARGHLPCAARLRHAPGSALAGRLPLPGSMIVGMDRRNVLLGLLAAVSMMAVACGEDPTTPTASPTTASTPVATKPPSTAPEAGGDAGFRAFARVLDTAIARGDVAFIEARFRLETTTCVAYDIEVIDNPYCDSIGQTYEGLPLGHWRSSGAIVPAANVHALLQERIDQQLRTERDGFGSGEARIGAINVEPGAYAAVMTALIPRPANFDPGGPLRVSVGMSWAFEDGRWRMTGALSAGVLAEELLMPGLAESPYKRLELFDARSDPSR